MPDYDTHGEDSEDSYKSNDAKPITQRKVKFAFLDHKDPKSHEDPKTLKVMRTQKAKVKV